MMGLVMMAELNGCARPIIESNYQKTQPLLTQMLCPTCDVPSLQPPAPTVTKAPQPVDPKTITTADNPVPASEASPTVDDAATSVETAPPPVAPVSASPSTPSKRVITLDLNAPDLGIHNAPTPAPAVPPQSKLEEQTVTQKTKSPHAIQLSEADIHNAQDIHELTVRLMQMNQ